MTAAEAISIMTPAVAIGNAISIVLGGILVKVIHSKELNGQGKLMRSADAADELGVSEEMQAKRDHIDVRNMGIGMFISCSFFAWGYIVAKIWDTLVPSISIHAYAWMIISVAVCKIFNIIPEDIEVDCYQWFQFIMKNLTPALLVGIGLCYLELGTVISSFSLSGSLLPVLHRRFPWCRSGWPFGWLLPRRGWRYRRSVYVQHGRHRRRGRSVRC